MRFLKRMLSVLLAAALMPVVFTAVPVMPDVKAETKSFDPENTIWTDNFVEDALKEGESGLASAYNDAAAVNPNASTSGDSGHQNPYGKTGENLTPWAYSEYLWTYSYPVGNGRMAAMVAGGIDKEVIQINEDTIWDGSPYGTLTDQDGNNLNSNYDNIHKDTVTEIKTVNPTSGSVEGGWKYYRGANEDGSPADIGSADAIVGDADFQSTYGFKSISNQALNVDNSFTQEAVQKRYQMERMVEKYGLGTPDRQKAYKSFVEVYLDFGQDYTNAANYTKSLDLKTGTVTVDYDYDGAHFKRETIASYPDQTVATKITSDSAMNFNATLHTYHEGDTKAYCKYEKVNDKDIKLTGSIRNGTKDSLGNVNVISFEAHMLLDGDSDCVFTVSSDNRTVTVSGGKEAAIYVVGASNYVDYLTLDNSKPAADCATYVENLSDKTFEQVRERHIADFAPLYAKSSLTLSNAEDADFSSTATEERVRKPISGASGFLTGADSSLSKAHSNGVYSTYADGDNQLAVLDFNYGKYLLISGSRDGREASGGNIAVPESQPLNLTGKWNAAMSASWNGKYTININTEMNYWAAQILGLAECERPLIDVFSDIAESGAITAKNQYGIFNSRGDDTYVPGDPWVMHHNFDLWRGTQPIDNATAGLWPTGGSWLLDHAWQYYKFTEDKEYLNEIYPLMKGAAAFFTQFLVVDPETGYLITAASCSPEQGGVQPGPAMDTQLVRNLYDMVVNAAEILGKTDEDSALIAKIKEQMPSAYLADEKGKVAPNVIDQGNKLIAEWVRSDVSFDFSISSTAPSGKTEGTDYVTVTNPFNSNTAAYISKHAASNNNGHRHCSQLWEMYPGTHLSSYATDPDEKAIYEAYQRSVASRGAGSGQGWGVAWRIALNARAKNAGYASELIEQLLTTRTSPNMFDQHPNFQIDGNYGITAGIAEMLIQSHDGSIDILPSIPERWADGKFEHFKARGNVDVSAKWTDGKPETVTVTPANGGRVTLRNKYIAKSVVKDSKGNIVDSYLDDAGITKVFFADADETYTLTSFGEKDAQYLTKTWTKLPTESTDRENCSIGGKSMIESVRNYGESKPAVFAYENCIVGGLETLTLNIASVYDGTKTVSVRLDTKDGTEIARGNITTVGDLIMDVTIPAGTTGNHKLYFVVWSDADTSTVKYIANINTLTGTYKEINPDYDPTVVYPPIPDEDPRSGYVLTGSYGADGRLNVRASYYGSDTPEKGILYAAKYEGSALKDINKIDDVEYNTAQNIQLSKPAAGETVRLYLWNENMKPLTSVPVTIEDE